jgi:hypothetical protein
VAGQNNRLLAGLKVSKDVLIANGRVRYSLMKETVGHLARHLLANSINSTLVIGEAIAVNESLKKQEYPFLVIFNKIMDCHSSFVIHGFQFRLLASLPENSRSKHCRRMTVKQMTLSGLNVQLVLICVMEFNNLRCDTSQDSE